MTLKLTPQDVSKYWEAVKVTLIYANGIPPEFEQEYCNKALEAILSGRFQVWVVFEWDEKGEQDIYGMGVTSIQIDKLFGYRFLSIDSYYGFKGQKPELILAGVEDLRAFARANECKKIRLTSANDRVIELVRMAGFEKEHATFTKNV